MIEFAKMALLLVISMWASIYIGSLAPRLWHQKNYRGAVGVTLIACLTFLLPIVLRIYSKS